MRRLRQCWMVCCTAFVLALYGCASVPPARQALPSNAAHWEGRLSFKIQTKPVQAMAATFELQGDPKVGSLVLSTPLGTTMARMQWGADGVVLQTNQAPQYFDSLDALTGAYLGHSVPIASLFAWLGGDTRAVPGWEVDATDLANGRLVARQVAPLTPVELKVVLER